LTPYLEIGGDYREVIAGVHLVELPLPFSLGLINVYLVRLEDGWMLVDAGMDTDSCFAALERAVEGLGIEWTSIRRILVTHMHPDHSGLAHRLLPITGARLMMHPIEAQLLNDVISGRYQENWEGRILSDAGVPDGLAAQIGRSFSTLRETFRPLKPDDCLEGGETVATAHGPLQVHCVGGHSPGHLCLHDPARRVLFSGDQILEHISPNIGWQPDRDALGEFLESLERLSTLEVDLILPSHGAPFQGHRDWVDRTRKHHAGRCRQIEAALSAEPKTAHELVGDLWNRKLSPFHHRFAAFEVLAHLEYLQQRDRVRAAREEGSLRWSLAA
jgi:glyoxylase-like metal-dependent hydrolase (beta-lactamase superfamily II)